MIGGITASSISAGGVSSSDQLLQQQQHCLVCYTPFAELSVSNPPQPQPQPQQQQQQQRNINSRSNNHTNSGSNNSVSTTTTITTTGTGNSGTTVSAIGITPCSHNEICALCHLRIRQLHSDLSCPICKTKNELIVVDYYVNSSSSNHRRQKGYEEYPIWGNELGKEYILHESSHMFFPIQYYQQTILPMIRYACTICTFGHYQRNNNNNNNNSHRKSQQLPIVSAESRTHRDDTAPPPSQPPPPSLSSSTTTLRQLQDHLRTRHTLTLCNVCMDHQRDFVSQLPRFPPSGLKRHNQQEHYSCPFCPVSNTTPYYDLNALYLHCHREHYRCHVCESHFQIQNEFYKNYTSLERHFDTRHYLCHHPECLASRFIVFHSDIDLAHHERIVHHIMNGGSKIQLEFKFHKHGNNNNNNDKNSSEKRNYQLDGTAFTPPALPSTSSNNNNSNNNTSDSSTQHGDSTTAGAIHAERTEQLRQQAASLRNKSKMGASNSNSDLQRLNESEIATISTAFPSLQQAAVPNSTASSSDDATTTKAPPNPNRLTIGWTADGSNRPALSLQRKAAGVVTEEDFPSLASNAKKKPTKTLLNNNNTVKKPLPTTATKSNGSSTNWTTATAAAQQKRTTTPPISLAYATMTAPSPSINNTMKAPPLPQPNVNLSDQQSFPSLDGGTKKKTGVLPYTAAQDFVAASGRPSNNVSRLPPLQNKKSLSMTSNRTNKAPALPDVSSSDFFPSLSISSNTNALKKVNAIPSTDNYSNKFTSSSPSSSLSIDAMKGVLGPVGYKAMKTYTREFVSHEMEADSYVDHMASLFPNGYTDLHFWNFVPELIRSFPTSADQSGAFAYLENLHRMRNGSLNHEAQYHSTKMTQQPPPSMSYATLTSSYTPTQPSITGSFTSSTSTLSSTKGMGTSRSNPTTNVWSGGGGGGNVNMTSAAAGTTKVTATNNYSNTTSNNNKKKSSGSGNNKQKNELRALAFGL